MVNRLRHKATSQGGCKQPAVDEASVTCLSRLVTSLPLPCPVQVNVGAGSHPNKVKVYGPGVAKTGLKAHEPTYFTVDCTEAGQGKALPQVGGHVGEASE